MTDQERTLQAALNAREFSEEVARVIAQQELQAEQQRQAQQRATFGERQVVGVM